MPAREIQRLLEECPRARSRGARDADRLARHGRPPEYGGRRDAHEALLLQGGLRAGAYQAYR